MLHPSTLLAFKTDRIPNAEAIALSPTLMWLFLIAAICAALMFITTADRWRRWWLTLEDPRAIAMFRIVFTWCVIINITMMGDYFTFLFTDEGIFTTDVARQVFAAKQFEGFGDGMNVDDPWGFFDIYAVIQFLQGPKYSLLFFWDSPTVFWVHMVAFWVASTSLMLGFRTRIAGILTWLLMNSILLRNNLPWEGTEVVFRCFLAYLILARSGHAYSIDNWLRCRRLRRQGRLSEPGRSGDGAGAPPSPEHPFGLEPIYRAIPTWPRKLLMLQLATVYLTTGCLKTGPVWMRGDALYYALNLDHFYRLPPQYLSSLLGTSVMRAMTWSVKIGQIAFPLILVSLIARWAKRQDFPALTGWRKWTLRGGFAGLIISTGLIAYVAWPVHFTHGLARTPFLIGWLVAWTLLWWLWVRLDRHPWIIRRGVRGPLSEPIVVDRTFVLTWFLGRRVLLVWHLAFHGHIYTLMSVGQFQTAMVSSTFNFLEGHEVATLMHDFKRALAQRLPFLPRAWANSGGIIPGEDLTRPGHHRDATVLEPWAYLIALVGIVGGLFVRGYVDPAWDWRLIWVATFAVIAITLISQRDPRRRLSPNVPPWAYGALGRWVIGSLIIWHLIAVAGWLLPAKDSFKSFQPETRAIVGPWLRLTQTTQGWGMFAPNPPRSNVFMKVLVTDAEGNVHDLKTDVYAPEQKPIPWIWNDRRRKMNRRIIGGESGQSEWYRKWYARYQCRQWALDHNGETPQKVELVKLSYRIPTPEQTRQKGYYVAEELFERAGKESVTHTEHCRTTVMGQLPDFIRARHGLPPLPSDIKFRPWFKRKYKKWQRKREQATRATSPTSPAKP